MTDSAPAAALAAQADDAFGADLYRLLAAGGGNMVFSPASVAAALRMALLGARGETAAQMAAALHLAGPRDAGDGLRLLSAGLAGLAGGQVTFRAPNTMWVQAGLALLPSYTSALAGLASVAVRDADFARAAGQARLEINAVIAEQTAGKIRDLLPAGAVSSATRLVLANAVYLKAAWAHPFPAGATGDQPFYPGGGARTVVAMMRLKTRLGYRRGDGFQAVVLPYVGGRLALAVVLPDGPLRPLEETLAAGAVRGLLTGVTQQQVRLALPRFTSAAAFDLGPALTSLGMTAPLRRGEADFSGIAAAGELFIGAVAHKAYIEVDEQGTEAAAATAVAVAGARFAVPDSPPIEVTVDRPFVFAITDSATGLPLFVGRITDPSCR
jgi:serpin B